MILHFALDVKQQFGLAKFHQLYFQENTAHTTDVCLRFLFNFSGRVIIIHFRRKQETHEGAIKFLPDYISNQADQNIST